MPIAAIDPHRIVEEDLVTEDPAELNRKKLVVACLAGLGLFLARFWVRGSH
jgi:hypothetical protein